MILKGILFLFLFSVLLLLAGDRFLHFLGWKRTIFASVCWGYVSILAVFQLVAFPLFRLSSSFSLLFWMFTLLIGLFVLLILLSVIIRQMKSEDSFLLIYKQNISAFLLNCKRYPFLAILLILSVLFCVFMSEGFYYSSSDEGYNIPRALETIAQNSLGVNDVLSWRGVYSNAAPPYNNASTYYFFIAWLSCISGIHTTVLYKTFFLLILISLHLSAICTMYDSVKPEHNFQNKACFLIFYIFFQMLCVKPSSAGTWMTGYLYEGKASMIAIVFPLLFSACANIIRIFITSDVTPKRDWLAVAAALTAGIELSIVGIFLPAILYFCLGTAFLIRTKFRYFSKIWLSAVLVTIPVIICGLFIVIPSLTLFSDVGGVLHNSADQISGNQGTVLLLFSFWKNHFLEAIDFWQFILFLGGVIYFFLHGDQIEKTLFVLFPFILLLTFLNPLLSNIVSEHITTSIVYWRLWWLLPVYFVPAAAITDIFENLTGRKIQNALAICIVFICTVLGFEIFRNSILDADYTVLPFAANVGKLFNMRPEFRTNLYNLNPGPLGIAESVLSDWDGEERPVVLMTFNRPFELRQYSQVISLATEVRDYHNVSGTIPGTDVDFGEFITSYNEIEDGAYLKDMLLILQVDYICFSESPSVNHLEEYGFRHICNSGGIDLWRVQK